MDQPVMSIVLTTHNSEGTIRDVLDSIVKQNFPLKNMELIIVDGGSNDGTVHIIEEFIKECGDNFCQVKFVIHDKNYGVSKARNDGIKLCTGKYMLILDHDVVLSQDTLASLLGYLENAPQKVVAATPLHHTQNGGLLTKWTESIMSNRLVKVEAITSCALVKRWIIDEIGYYDETLGPPFTVYEDIEYGVRALSKGYEIHLLGWLKVKHKTHEASDSRGRRFVIPSSIIAKFASILRSLSNPNYGYALRKYLTSAPLTYKIRWRLYSAAIPMLATAVLAALAFTAFSPLIISIFVIFTLYLDVLRQYWNPRVLHISLLYSAVALAWRIARSTMLLIPTKSICRVKK